MNKSDDYLWDRSGDADPEVARLEALMSPLAHDAPLRVRRRRAPWIAASVAVAAAASVVVWWKWPGARPSACTGTTGFKFTSRGGPVECGGAAVASGELPIGGELDTGAHEADLSIADIGKARLGAKTKVRLDGTSATGHHLTLEQGQMHARVAAPPRLFQVSTKSTEVTDLGCEYTIQIDAAGAGQIRVQTGRVELQTKSGAIVVAPRKTSTAILPGRQPGLPVGDAASPALLGAVEDFQRGRPGAIERILAAATADDAITVINLAAVLGDDRDHKHAVLQRLAELSPPPTDITADRAATDDKVLGSWRSDVISGHRD
jgi:ferric-dicitrate binding protein FerR (iron transport regulator)